MLISFHIFFYKSNINTQGLNTAYGPYTNHLANGYQSLDSSSASSSYEIALSEQSSYSHQSQESISSSAAPAVHHLQTYNQAQQLQIATTQSAIQKPVDLNVVAGNNATLNGNASLNGTSLNSPTTTATTTNLNGSTNQLNTTGSNLNSPNLTNSNLNSPTCTNNGGLSQAAVQPTQQTDQQTQQSIQLQLNISLNNQVHQQQQQQQIKQEPTNSQIGHQSQQTTQLRSTNQIQSNQQHSIVKQENSQQANHLPQSRLTGNETGQYDEHRPPVTAGQYSNGGLTPIVYQSKLNSPNSIEQQHQQFYNLQPPNQQPQQQQLVQLNHLNQLQHQPAYCTNQLQNSSSNLAAQSNQPHHLYNSIQPTVNNKESHAIDLTNVHHTQSHHHHHLNNHHSHGYHPYLNNHHHTNSYHLRHGLKGFNSEGKLIIFFSCSLRNI